MKGKQVTLRLPEPTDLELLYSWENNTENWLVSLTHTPFSRATLEKYLHSVHDIFQDRQIRFLICLSDQRPIGCVDLFELDLKNRNAGLGVLIGDSSDREKGYALEALALMCAYAFETLGLQNLFCHISEKNTASQKLFEKLQFEMVGRKKNWIRNGAQWEDELLYQRSLNKLI